MKHIQVTIVQRPRRTAIVKRGKTAEDYFSYCEEVGCEVWEALLTMPSLDGEPVCLWLPDRLIAPGTSRYVQGVEVEVPFPAPDGFDAIDLPAAAYLRFQGQPFEEETFCQAIDEVWDFMEGFDPGTLGYAWDEESPRIQLEPRCERGYVELKAVRKL